ncbi:MAG: hypothetical protein KKH88_02345 [Nanoarchaeota archaeon]|nr:hypothetical protein [Nanoarchaeota archaeon]MBU1445139.1 hypothetical protein [Nanoarchaeota archaeon]MBU2406631.1 hypothetical protein [Nanoarchaeota archaeon]MBU2420075.1 hypothetical protein [Nanoarchaeota archaeon]MBU2475566.1 hypothetical protein [Nanoarchaeota archaeon]
MEKKFWLVILAFLVCIYSVSAWTFYYGYGSGNFDIFGFYQRYYQLIDLVLYFLFFSAIANLTIGQKFKGTDMKSANILTGVFGLVMSLVLVFFETNYYRGPLIFQQANAFLIFILIVLVLFAIIALTGFIKNVWIAGVIGLGLGLLAWNNLQWVVSNNGWYAVSSGSLYSLNSLKNTVWVFILLAVAVAGFALQGRGTTHHP